MAEGGGKKGRSIVGDEGGVALFVRVLLVVNDHWITTISNENINPS